MDEAGASPNGRREAVPAIVSPEFAHPTLADGVVGRRALFERLERSARVTQLSGPAGSGKKRNAASPRDGLPSPAVRSAADAVAFSARAIA